MKVEDFCKIKCLENIVVVDNEYTNERVAGSRNKHLVCHDYDRTFEFPEIQNADIEYISLYYDNCYYEGDEPSIALHINYKGD